MEACATRLQGKLFGSNANGGLRSISDAGYRRRVVAQIGASPGTAQVVDGNGVPDLNLLVCGGQAVLAQHIERGVGYRKVEAGVVTSHRFGSPVAAAGTGRNELQALGIGSAYAVGQGFAHIPPHTAYRRV